MARRNGHGSVRKKSIKKIEYPQVYFDKDADFASIKLSAGIEVRSYVKDGVIFCENEAGEIIEIQVLNPSIRGSRKPSRAA